MSVSTQKIDKHGSVALTSGVRVSVQPKFLPQHSGGQNGRWVFGYDIEIRNESEREIKLVSRYWKIVDADGTEHEVRGDGVVGVQPSIEPGEAFDYASFCPLETPWGTMEGSYRVLCGASGEMFDVQVARFYLVADEDADF